MTQEEKQVLHKEHSEAIDQILETIQKIKGDEYVTRLMVVYALMLVSRVGHSHGLPTAEIGLNGIACAFSSWGLSAHPLALDLARDAKVLVEHSVYGIPNAG